MAAAEEVGPEPSVRLPSLKSISPSLGIRKGSRVCLAAPPSEGQDGADKRGTWSSSEAASAAGCDEPITAIGPRNAIAPRSARPALLAGIGEVYAQPREQTYALPRFEGGDTVFEPAHLAGFFFLTVLITAAHANICSLGIPAPLPY